MGHNGETSDVIGALQERIREHELEAAHAEEYLKAKTPASLEVQTALRAAVHHGIALGLRQAVDLVEDAFGGDR